MIRRYIIIAALLLICVGCVHTDTMVRNDYIPCDVCGVYDDRAVFLHKMYYVGSTKYTDIICHMECFNNLIDETNKIMEAGGNE